MYARKKELVEVFRWDGHEIESPRWAAKAVEAGIITIPKESEYDRRLLGIWVRGEIAIAYPGWYLMKSEEGEITAITPEKFNQKYEIVGGEK